MRDRSIYSKRRFRDPLRSLSVSLATRSSIHVRATHDPAFVTLHNLPFRTRKCRDAIAQPRFTEFGMYEWVVSFLTRDCSIR